jgi:hypothetical protein
MAGRVNENGPVPVEIEGNGRVGARVDFERSMNLDARLDAARHLQRNRSAVGQHHMTRVRRIEIQAYLGDFPLGKVGEAERHRVGLEFEQIDRHVARHDGCPAATCRMSSDLRDRHPNFFNGSSGRVDELQRESAVPRWNCPFRRH